ncbi:MAG: hypothetical protein ACRD01_01085 [Terriglobales bacterium]
MDRPQLAELGPGPSVEWLILRVEAFRAAIERQHRAELRAGTEALPRLCAEYHLALLEALEAVLPVRAVIAEDEFAFRLVGQERMPVNARLLAAHLRAAVQKAARPFISGRPPIAPTPRRKRRGGPGRRAAAEIRLAAARARSAQGASKLPREAEWLRCGIGIAPNRYVAGVAARQPGPEGLTLWLPTELPEALYGLRLEQLPGITAELARRMESLGVGTVQELCHLDVAELRRLWTGAEGERMWHWLRGGQFEPEATERRTLGRQHVLSPEQRTPDGTFAAAKNLLHEAAEELRQQRLLAGSVGAAVNFLDDRKPRGQGPWLGAPSWSSEAHLQPCGDSFTLQRHLARLWEGCPRRPAILVYVWLSGLLPERAGRRAAAG